MRTRTATLALAFALLASGAAVAATGATGTLVSLHKTSLGKVVATSKGFTLYLYTGDRRNKSTCSGYCSSLWPPLTTNGKPRAGQGVKQSLLGTTRRSNGKLQVTYNGHPLYRYSNDKKPGQTTGEGWSQIWYAVSAAGKKVTGR
jgi:predicted lipoprotein with Yx(FWY)xxD motif